MARTIKSTLETDVVDMEAKERKHFLNAHDAPGRTVYLKNQRNSLNPRMLYELAMGGAAGREGHEHHMKEGVGSMARALALDLRERGALK